MSLANQDEPNKRNSARLLRPRTLIARMHTHLCASDENSTDESSLIFVTRPTCRNSCTLPDESRGIYFRIGMTPPSAFTVVPRRTAPDPLLTPRRPCRFLLSEVRGCLPARVRATINRYIGDRKRPSRGMRSGQRRARSLRSIARFPDGQTNPTGEL